MRRECLEIVHEVFLVGHTTEYGEYTRIMSCKAECPRCHAILRTTLLEACYQVVAHLCQSATQQRFHDVHRNVALSQFVVQVFGMVVARSMLPVHIVELDHGEIPLHIHSQHVIECLHIAMERPSEVTDASGFAFLQEEIEQTIVDKSFLKCFDALTATNGVEEIVIDIIHLKVLQGVAVHLYRLLEVRDARIRHLGSDEELVTRMAFEGDTHSRFRLTLEIDRSRIEEVHPMLDGIVYQFVYLFLIHNIFSFFVLLHRPTHTSVAKQRNLVACIRIDTVCHFTCRLTTRTFYRPFLIGLAVR